MAGARHGMYELTARHGHGMICVNRPLHGHLHTKQKCPSLRHDRVNRPSRISAWCSSLRCFFDFGTPDVFQDRPFGVWMYCRWLRTNCCEPADVQSRGENYLLELGPNFIWESDYKENGLKRLDTRSLLLNMFCTNRLLVASEKLGRETISFVVCVRPSARMEQLGSIWTAFHEISYLNIFRKSIGKILGFIKNLTKVTDTLHEDLCKFMTISSRILPRMRNVLGRTCRENKKNLVFNNFSKKSSCLWDNVEKYCRAGQATDGSIIRRMRFACWMTKATDTHSEYVIIIAFPQQQWLRERDSLLRYSTHIASTVFRSVIGSDSIVRMDEPAGKYPLGKPRSKGEGIVKVGVG